MILLSDAIAAVHQWGAQPDHIQRAGDIARSLSAPAVSRLFIEQALHEAGILSAYDLMCLNCVGSPGMGWEVVDEIEMRVVYGSMPPDFETVEACASEAWDMHNLVEARRGLASTPAPTESSLKVIHHYGPSVVIKGTDIFVATLQNMPLATLRLRR